MFYRWGKYLSSVQSHNKNTAVYLFLVYCVGGCIASVAALFMDYLYIDRISTGKVLVEEYSELWQRNLLMFHSEFRDWAILVPIVIISYAYMTYGLLKYLAKPEKP